ncbi:MAG TPA: TetR/AcrR family transcriptional regulator [Mycobacteriales bacterium]|jgi:AcrR family transcriptional regulator|nr:TetR/AcrR family transcriptional regulator [Mycobacteriales bacterium]
MTTRAKDADVPRALRADAQRNRDKLVEVAAAAFARDGIDTSLEEIARTAGVGIGTLYRHFPNRDALLEAVFRRNVDDIAAQADELLEALPADQALAEWMSRFVRYVATKKGLAAHLKSVVSHDAEIFAYSHAKMDSVMQRLVEAGQREGTVRPDVDYVDVLKGLSGVCMMSDVPGWQDQACRVSGLLMDGLRYGVPASPAKKRRPA